MTSYIIFGINVLIEKTTQKVKFTPSFFRAYTPTIVESNGTVLSTGNFGNKPDISPMIMISEYNESNGSVIFRTSI